MVCLDKLINLANGNNIHYSASLENHTFSDTLVNPGEHSPAYHPVWDIVPAEGPRQGVGK